MAATGQGMMAATLWENMAVSSVARNHTAAFNPPRLLSVDFSNLRRHQNRRSRSTYATATNATADGSSMERYTAAAELYVRNARPSAGSHSVSFALSIVQKAHQAWRAPANRVTGTVEGGGAGLSPCELAAGCRTRLPRRRAVPPSRAGHVEHSEEIRAEGADEEEGDGRTLCRGCISNGVVTEL
ncbi:hypothetical protein BHM03_00037677 [Ensete ventricosum]|nr:hypothetical protein BHM03_00037677 [Ensete ventricosum]